MARFRFRLEASLNLAKQVLNEAQRCLAVEIEHFQAILEARNLQEQRWREALKGQEEAGSREPERLGLWRAYAERTYELLKVREQELLDQQARQEQARGVVIEAHREVEKLKRLKEKQREAFEREALRREQKIHDETGQVLYRRTQVANDEEPLSSIEH